MKKSVIVALFSVFVLFVTAVPGGQAAEWKAIPAKGEVAVLQVGEAIQAGFVGPRSIPWVRLHELSYTGCEGTIVHFYFREYFMNRDASMSIKAPFSLPLTFDLSKSKTIGYFDMRVDVLEYSNFGIKIKMIEPLSKR